jgi:hypothetical protein
MLDKTAYFTYERIRHHCVSDNHRFVYVIGSEVKAAWNKVERYDSLTREVISLEDTIYTKGTQFTVCFFNLCGRGKGKLYVLQKDVICSLKVQNDYLLHKWERVTLNVPLNCLSLTELGKQGMVQLNTDQLLIFGGEDQKAEDSSLCFLLTQTGSE